MSLALQLASESTRAGYAKVATFAPAISHCRTPSKIDRVTNNVTRECSAAEQSAAKTNYGRIGELAANVAAGQPGSGPAGADRALQPGLMTLAKARPSDGASVLQLVTR